MVSKRRCTDMSNMENISNTEQNTEMSIEQAQDPEPHSHLSQGNHQSIWLNQATHTAHHAGDNNSMFNNNNVSNTYITGHDQQQEENNNQISYTHQSFSQDEMIMDLNEEVYSRTQVNLYPSDITTDAEYEAACSMVAAMEGEGAPDPQQYRLSTHNPVCGATDVHSPLGKPLCLGRSPLKGAADMQPYLSDYY